MRIASRITAAITFALVLVSTTISLWAAPTAQQRQQAKKLDADLRRAAVLFTQGNYEKCGVQVAAVQSSLTALAKAGGKDVQPLLTPLHKRLVRAHALLVLEGVQLDDLQPLDTMISGKPAPGAPDGKVGFVSQVAPILVGKCGRCHVNRANGEFSMVNYATLMKGPAEGVVIFAGDAVGSRLIEVIESGDMPRGGLKVSADELATLKNWIEEGAKFDGDDPMTTLSQLAPDASTDLPRVEVMAATGKETISFSRDLAGILNEKCANCHGNGRRPSARFNLTTFRGMLNGGESGPPVVPGKPDDSLLIKKLKGVGGGQQMPLRQPPLSSDVIAKFETWIREGAAFDGPDPNQHVRDVAALAKARMSTHDQLSADRAKRAVEQWNLGMPGVDFERLETVNYLMLGDLGPNTLADYGKRAEAMSPKVAAAFGLPTDKPLVKGRLTVFLFRQRYDYSEFGKMVEKRSLPKEWRGHWQYNVVDAYTALIPPRNDAYSADILIAQQLAGVYVASQNNPPRWFSEGSARVVASRLGPEDPRVKQWDAELPRIFGEMTAPGDFLTGKLAPEDANICAYSFVKFLMKDSAKYRSLLRALGQGEDFDKAFPQVYGAAPGQVTAAWARSASRRRR